MRAKGKIGTLFLSVLLAFVMILGMGTALWAEKFPNKPVQLVVPFGPGGADRSARLFAPYLSKELGVPVQVINIEGGGGWVAWSQAAKWDGAKDDHMLQIINVPHIFSYLDPRAKRRETLDSFGFLAWHSYDPCIWAVREGDKRFQTLKEFIDYVQAHPNEIIVSTTGVGSDDHMGMAYAQKNIPNFKVKMIYSNNDGKKITETLGSHSDMAAGNVGFYIPYVLDMKLRPICVLHHERWALMPSVQTFYEVTGKKNVSYAGRTIAAAKNLPEEKKKIYIDALERAIKNPEYVMKEMNNKNSLLFLKGDKLWEALNNAKAVVEDVKFWELKTK